MSAPERIWADDDGIWHTFDYSEIRPSIEFVRADIAASQFAEAQAEIDVQRESKKYAQRCCEAAEAERDRLAAENARLEVENATLRMHAEARAILDGLFLPFHGTGKE